MRITRYFIKRRIRSQYITCSYRAHRYDQGVNVQDFWSRYTYRFLDTFTLSTNSLKMAKQTRKGLTKYFITSMRQIRAPLNGIFFLSKMWGGLLFGSFKNVSKMKFATRRSITMVKADKKFLNIFWIFSLFKIYSLKKVRGALISGGFSMALWGMPKIAIFPKKSVFVDYSTVVEYSVGHKIFFWTTNLYKISPKIFRSFG